jgi:hypothetical protein
MANLQTDKIIMEKLTIVKLKTLVEISQNVTTPFTTTCDL